MVYLHKSIFLKVCLKFLERELFEERKRFSKRWFSVGEQG